MKTTDQKTIHYVVTKLTEGIRGITDQELYQLMFILVTHCDKKIVERLKVSFEYAARGGRPRGSGY